MHLFRVGCLVGSPFFQDRVDHSQQTARDGDIRLLLAQPFVID
jgi:hypothetical protein